MPYPCVQGRHATEATADVRVAKNSLPRFLSVSASFSRGSGHRDATCFSRIRRVPSVLETAHKVYRAVADHCGTMLSSGNSVFAECAAHPAQGEHAPHS